MRPLFSKGSAAGLQKCMPKTVNFDHSGVEVVKLKNFKYLFIICIVLALVSFVVLFVENVQKMQKENWVTPI